MGRHRAGHHGRCQGDRRRFSRWAHAWPPKSAAQRHGSLGVHGTTYGGNPLAMAVGNAVLDVILDDGFLPHVNDVALVLRQGLASLKDRYPDLIADVRGSGLMLGIKCAKSNADLVAAMRSEHLLAVPAGDNVVRLLPPLIVTTEEAREALARTEAALEMLSRNGAAN
jgi:acetylornithine/N-succinyldiaminopimelate aminotransferase